MSLAGTLFVFPEAALDQGRECGDHLGRLRATRFDCDGRAGPGREHHQAHDRGAADPLVAAPHPDLGIVLLDRHHELGRGAGVQAAPVADRKHADDVGRARLFVRGAGRLGHVPVSTRLAMVTYLRPASCAASTASCSGHSSRTLASLTSMGRLMPASTSTCGRLITEMARLEGVPPNMSVRMATPWPLSTRLTASMMSLRRCSTSSSGPMVTASICCCGPTTCSSAERNSTASRPCVTRTRPIIETPRGHVPGAPHERTAILTIRSLRARAFPPILWPWCTAISGARQGHRQERRLRHPSL